MASILSGKPGPTVFPGVFFINVKYSYFLIKFESSFQLKYHPNFYPPNEKSSNRMMKNTPKLLQTMKMIGQVFWENVEEIKMEGNSEWKKVNSLIIFIYL